MFKQFIMRLIALSCFGIIAINAPEYLAPIWGILLAIMINYFIYRETTFTHTLLDVIKEFKSFIIVGGFMSLILYSDLFHLPLNSSNKIGMTYDILFIFPLTSVLMIGILLNPIKTWKHEMFNKHSLEK